MSKIADIPLIERPREKAIRYGIESLSNNELLALIIGSGTKNKSALEIADELLASNNGLVNLSRTTLNNLISVKGLNKISSLRLLAVFQIYLRLLNYSFNEGVNVNEIVKNIALKYQKILSHETQEELHLIMLNKNYKIQSEKMVYKGTELRSSVSVNEILQKIKDDNVIRFIIIHNHTKASSQASDNDLHFTYELMKQAQNEGLELVDHIIVSKNSVNSLLGLFE